MSNVGLSLGMGVPLFVLALSSGLINKLPHSGEWMVWVHLLMGWILVGMAAYFIQPLFPGTAGTFILAAVALAAGLHLGWLNRTTVRVPAFGWIEAVAGTAGLIITTLLIAPWVIRGPGVAWQPYSDKLLLEAMRSDKPVIMDFTADWCTPCRKLENVTFHDPRIVQWADREFTMIKVDLTSNENPAHQRLVREYDVEGVPTIVFLDRR